MGKHPLVYAALTALLFGCGGTSTTSVSMKVDYTGTENQYFSPTLKSTNDGRFYHNGFPTNLRLRDDGSVKISDFPREFHALTISYKTLVENSVAPSIGGYHTISTIYLPFTEHLAIQRLPTKETAYANAESSIQVVDIDPNSPEYGRRFPLKVTMTDGIDSYRPDNLLQLAPTLGIPLRSNTTYAALVTDRAPVASGYELVQNPQLAAVLGASSFAGDIPQKAFDVFAPLRDFLAQQSIAPDSIIGATVWTTGNPATPLVKGVERVRSLPQKAPKNLTVLKDFPDYCVIQGQIEIPMFQNGTAPYYVYGGYMLWDENGFPEVRKTRNADFVVTIPKGVTMPSSGYANLFYHHGAGGTSEQVFQRGGKAPHELDDGGNGPSRIAAARGWSSAGIGGHLGQDHLSLVEGYGGFPYDILQGVIMRNNYFQMIWERVFFRKFLSQFTLDASYCPDADPGTADGFKFDSNMQVLMGQSLGNWTGSLQLAADTEPFKGAILGGVSGTWIRNLAGDTKKNLPLALGAINLYPGEKLDEAHPFLMLMEWLLGSVEPVAMVGGILKEPTKTAPHIYIASGLNDGGADEVTQRTFLMALGVDLAGDDVGDTEDTTLLPYMTDMVGTQQYSYPVTNNVEVPGQGRRTAVVTRYVNTIRDNGHHVMFDLFEPKHQYGCFLEHIGSGRTPQIGAGFELNGPCL